MKMNSNFQAVVEESDLIQYIYNGVPLSKYTVSKTDWLDRFNYFSELFDLPDRIPYELESTVDQTTFIGDCIGLDGWNIPEPYYSMDMRGHLIGQCQTPEQVQRVELELTEFNRRNMLPVLKFLLYFVNTLRDHKIVWGVGRGSSVASYVLYLLGVHKIDSLKYNLDIKEFLK